MTRKQVMFLFNNFGIVMFIQLFKASYWVVMFVKSFNFLLEHDKCIKLQ